MDSVTSNPPSECQVGTIEPQPKIPEPEKIIGFQALADELFACSHSSPKKLCEIIGRDVALKAEVIALANAFIFSFGRPVRSLAQAVACLGYDRCYKLALEKLGIASDVSFQAQEPENQKPEAGSTLRIPGVRPYRKQRLSSLYPPKSRGVRPHFLTAEQGRT